MNHQFAFRWNIWILNMWNFIQRPTEFGFYSSYPLQVILPGKILNFKHKLQFQLHPLIQAQTSKVILTLCEELLYLLLHFTLLRGWAASYPQSRTWFLNLNLIYSFSFLQGTHILVFTQTSVGLYLPKINSLLKQIQTIDTELNISSIFIGKSNNQFLVSNCSICSFSFTFQ